MLLNSGFITGFALSVTNDVVQNVKSCKDKAVFFLFVGTLILVVAGVRAAPHPGAVFREYVYAENGEGDGFHRAIALDAKIPPGRMQSENLPNQTHSIVVPDLDDAVQAEFQIELLQCHRGTYGHQVTINGNPPVMIPGPTNIPVKAAGVDGSGHVELHQTMRYPCVEIPLDSIKPGTNTFRVDALGQYPMYMPDLDAWAGWTNWGQSLWYGAIIRIYYSSNKPHTNGEITSPVSGGSIGDNPVVTAAADGSVRQIDFLADYEGINWEGDNVYKQWKYIFRNGAITKHIGTDSEAPYAVTWNTEWIPDQKDAISICARIHDTNGIIYITPAVEGVRLERTARSVVMYKNSRIPEGMQIRGKFNGRYMSRCEFVCNDSMTNAMRARAFYSAWSRGYLDSLSLNGHEVQGSGGDKYVLSFEDVDVDPAFIRQGTNVWSFHAEATGHGIEVNWPGPTLIIEYQ